LRGHFRFAMVAGLILCASLVALAALWALQGGRPRKLR
jgi:hypothetical protein